MIGQIRGSGEEREKTRVFKKMLSAAALKKYLKEKAATTEVTVIARPGGKFSVEVRKEILVS